MLRPYENSSPLPPGKCPGPSGLRSDHLTHLPVATYESLARLLQLILEGRTLPPIARWLLGNSKVLVLPQRDNEGARTSIKPIGIPELLRKLAGKWILRSLRQRMFNFVAPLQVGIAFAGGCELDVLPTRLQLNETDNPRLQECLQCREPLAGYGGLDAHLPGGYPVSVRNVRRGSRVLCSRVGSDFAPLSESMGRRPTGRSPGCQFICECTPSGPTCGKLDKPGRFLFWYKYGRTWMMSP